MPSRRLRIGAFVALAGASGFAILCVGPGDAFDREPSRVSANESMAEYEARSGCEKQAMLWGEIERSRHATRPPIPSFGAVELLKMKTQGFRKKVRFVSDVAPRGWVKYIHARGSVAKVEWVEDPGAAAYSGLLRGARCGLLRLSLTYDPTERGVAPGAALKLFRDGHPSANVSFLSSLQPQGQDYDFFRSSLSNVVPPWDDTGAKLVHWAFRRVSGYPETLAIRDLAAFGEDGRAIDAPRFPPQLFLVPKLRGRFDSAAHDVRDDFESLKAGTVLYEIRAVVAHPRGFNPDRYTEADRPRLEAESVRIGDLVLRSPFVSSEYGDTSLFFRHQTIDEPTEQR